MAGDAVSNVDPELLCALDALLRERHVSAAAARLGITQPAMSQRLKRLRDIFQDPLLVPGRDGLRLTPRAAELRQPLNAVFDALDAMLRSVPSAQPAPPRLRLAVPDLGVPFAGADLRLWCERAAPGVEIAIVRIRSLRPEAISPETIDMCVSYAALLPQIPSGYQQQFLPADTLLYGVRPGHRLAESLTALEALADFGHISVAVAEPIERQLDQLLHAVDRQRTTAWVADCYDAAAEICAASDLVMVIPAFLARNLQAAERLMLRPVPALRHGLPVSMMWRSELSGDGAVRAIRAKLSAWHADQHRHEAVPAGIAAAWQSPGLAAIAADAAEAAD